MNGLSKFSKKYRLACTLSFGDIYGQIAAWLGVVFVSLALTVATMSRSPLMALGLLGLIMVISLPFLLFGFVTTLFNHIEVLELDRNDEARMKTPVFTHSSDQN